MPLPELVVFCGGMGGSPVEDMLADAQAADALDAIEKVTASGAVAGVILVTDRPEIAQGTTVDVKVDQDDGPFHFGERLLSVVRRHDLERIIYVGAGSAPLMHGEDFFSMGHYLQMAWNVVLTNNLYSADIVGFVPAEALARIDLPSRDNPLARLLHDQAGFAIQDLPRTAASQFNIDSPCDLAVLKLVGVRGPRLTAWIEGAELDVSRLQRCLPLFTNRDAEILVAGRVGSQVWQHLEKDTACRVRLFSEERGMQAAGREQLGQARSLLGYHLQEVGCRRFFEELAEMADAAFIDSRVIIAHRRQRPSRADRFLSDVGRWEEIADPFLREFTEAAVSAPIPVILGGHSLVAGGIMALIEAAWQDHDRQQDGSSGGREERRAAPSP